MRFIVVDCVIIDFRYRYRFPPFFDVCNQSTVEKRKVFEIYPENQSQLLIFSLDQIFSRIEILTIVVIFNTTFETNHDYQGCEVKINKNITVQYGLQSFSYSIIF